MMKRDASYGAIPTRHSSDSKNISKQNFSQVDVREPKLYWVGEAARLLGIKQSELRYMLRTNKIQHTKSSGGYYLISQDEIDRQLGNKKSMIYVRAHTDRIAKWLSEQLQIFATRNGFNNIEIVTDISSLTKNAPGLTRIFDVIDNGLVDKLIIDRVAQVYAGSDRELFNRYLRQNGVKLIEMKLPHFSFSIHDALLSSLLITFDQVRGESFDERARIIYDNMIKHLIDMKHTFQEKITEEFYEYDPDELTKQFFAP